MQTLTSQLVEQGFTNRILTDALLNRIVEGSKQRRYHLVSRAAKAGELVRLRQGIYILNTKYREHSCHPFAFAQILAPGSYVSLETALAYHGWIPEAVFDTASILTSRKSKEFTSDQLGRFTFHPMAINKGYFLELVERVQLNQQTMLVAKPIRALIDLVCYKKIEWQGLGWIKQGMRIDDEYLNSITNDDIRKLKHVYKQKRVHLFLSELEAALGLEPGVIK